MLRARVSIVLGFPDFRGEGIDVNLGGMPEFLLETYMAAQESLPNVEARVRDATAELAAGGVAVRYLSGTFIPADELCWHLLEGPSRDAVAEAARRAGVLPLRIVETARTGSGENGKPTREAYGC